MVKDPNLGIAQPTRCPWPMYPIPKAPSEAVALRLLEAGNATEFLLEMGGQMPRDTLLSAFAEACSGPPLAPGMLCSPVWEVVPVEIVVQVAVTAAGGGERRTSHLHCGTTNTVEQQQLGTAGQGPPRSVHHHPWGHARR